MSAAVMKGAPAAVTNGRAAHGAGSWRTNPGAQAFWLLRLVFTVAPILFGLDKFAHVLVDWERYLAPELADVLPGTTHELKYAVGVIEIVAGLVVAARLLGAVTLARLAGAFRPRFTGA